MVHDELQKRMSYTVEKDLLICATSRKKRYLPNERTCAHQPRRDSGSAAPSGGDTECKGDLGSAPLPLAYKSSIGSRWVDIRCLLRKHGTG